MISTKKAKGSEGFTSFWASKTNGEILTTNFRSDDPEALSHLLAELPQGDEVPELEFEYDTRQSAVGMVRCRHCKKNSANHNIGFVLRYQDGSRILVGKNCGAKQYGQVFTYRAGHFRKAIKRQELLRRKLGIISVRKEIVAVLDQIAEYEGWVIYRNSKRAFWRVMHDLVNLVNTAALKRDGLLSVESRYRDTEAEADYWNKNRKVSPPIYKCITTDIGVLTGRDFFRGGETPETIVPALRQRMINGVFAIDDLERDSELEITFRAMVGLVGELREQAHRIDVMKAAMTDTNMITLGRWLKAEGHGSYRVKEGKFGKFNGAGEVVYHMHPVYDCPDRRNPIQFDLPPAFAPAPHALIDRLAELLSNANPGSTDNGNKSPV